MKDVKSQNLLDNDPLELEMSQVDNHLSTPYYIQVHSNAQETLNTL